MTTEQLPSTSDTTEQQWGAPQNRPPQRWSTKKTVASVAIAAAVVAAGGAAIYAASGSTDSSATGMQGGPGGGQMQGAPGGSTGTTTDSLHGEFVVSDGNGGYTTELTQTGTVTELSATELTAKSADGYTKTYTIGSADLTDIASGDTVTLTATVSNNAATLETVTEGTGQTRRDQTQGQP